MFDIKLGSILFDVVSISYRTNSFIYLVAYERPWVISVISLFYRQDEPKCSQDRNLKEKIVKKYLIQFYSAKAKFYHVRICVLLLFYIHVNVHNFHIHGFLFHAYDSFPNWNTS